MQLMACLLAGANEAEMQCLNDGYQSSMMTTVQGMEEAVPARWVGTTKQLHHLGQRTSLFTF